MRELGREKKTQDALDLCMSTAVPGTHCFTHLVSNARGSSGGDGTSDGRGCRERNVLVLQERLREATWLELNYCISAAYTRLSIRSVREEANNLKQTQPAGFMDRAMHVQGSTCFCLRELVVRGLGAMLGVSGGGARRVLPFTLEGAAACAR